MARESVSPAPEVALGTLAILLSAACFSEPAPVARPDVQHQVDYYAPGIVIGDRVSSSTHARYTLHPAPYLGLRDTIYVGPDGTRRLGLEVNEYVDDANPQVSRWARVKRVFLEIPDTTALRAVRRRLTASLGASAEKCYLYPGVPNDPARVVHALRWTGRGEGVELRYTYFPTPAESLSVALTRFTSGEVIFAPGAGPVFTNDTIPCEAT